jgi:hypothetical protein
MHLAVRWMFNDRKNLDRCVVPDVAGTAHRADEAVIGHWNTRNRASRLFRRRALPERLKRRNRCTHRPVDQSPRRATLRSPDIAALGNPLGDCQRLVQGSDGGPLVNPNPMAGIAVADVSGGPAAALVVRSYPARMAPGSDSKAATRARHLHAGGLSNAEPYLAD